MSETRASAKLTPEQRQRVLAEVYRELFVSCPAREGELRTIQGARLIETHLDALVDMVRRSTATTVEPYLAQVHEDVCSRCTHQDVSGFCAQRVPGPCAVYRFAEPIVRAVGRALAEMGDEQYLAVHSAE
jgi:hypothetical protein